MGKKFHIKVGDNVTVLSGNERGKTGNVLTINKDKDRATVEGLNMVKVHKKPSAEQPNGGIEEKEAGIHVSNLMVNDKSGKPSRIGKKMDSKGNKTRYSIKSGEEI